MIRDITSILQGLAIIILGFVVMNNTKGISSMRVVIGEQTKVIRHLGEANLEQADVNRRQTTLLNTLEKVDGKLFEAIVKNTGLVASR